VTDQPSYEAGIIPKEGVRVVEECMELQACEFPEARAILESTAEVGQRCSRSLREFQWAIVVALISSRLKKYQWVMKEINGEGRRRD
jgi:hypothetical protein